MFGLGGWTQVGSLSPAFPLFQPAPPIVSTTQSLTVDAIVSAGAVSDLSIDFNDSASGGPASSNESFHASGGTWSESSFFQLVGAGPSDSASGAYTITQLTSVPEPAPGWLIFVGLASAAIFGRRRRARPDPPGNRYAVVLSRDQTVNLAQNPAVGTIWSTGEGVAAS